MTYVDEKQFYFGEIEEVRRKRDVLPPDHPIRIILCEDLLRPLENRIHTTAIEDLTFSKSPYAYGFCASSSVESLIEFGADVALVGTATAERHNRDIVKFLQLDSDKKPGEWYGGLFECWAKATVLRQCHDVILDRVLPNGRDQDFSLSLLGRRINFECTSLSDDDESLEVWERFINDRKRDPHLSLVRPGPYCPPNSKGPSPYYMVWRLYLKIYDKLTKNLIPPRSFCKSR